MNLAISWLNHVIIYIYKYLFLMVECQAQVPTFDLQGASTVAEGSCISRGAGGDTTVTWVGFAKRLTGSYQQNCQLLVSIGFAVVHH
jgi:hypothetical protein